MRTRSFRWFLETLILVLISLQSSALTTKDLSYVADVTWASKYMIDGFKVGGDNPVLQLTALTKLADSGFSVMYWNSIQTDRHNKRFDEHDFFLRYSTDFFVDRPYQLNLHGFADYWVFPNSEPKVDEFGDTVSTAKMHGNKVQLGVSLPKIRTTENSTLIPTYNLYYLTYWAQDRDDLFQGGLEQELSVQYDQSIRSFIPNATYQYISLIGTTIYHHGAFGVREGISHSTATVLSGVYALKSIFTLGLNHQWTYEQTVNSGNEFWTTFSYIKKF